MTMGDEQTHPAGDGGAWGTWVGRIEQLEAENQRLRAAYEDAEQQVADVVEPYLDRHLATLPDLACQIVALFAPEIDRLEAENQRLTDENARAWNACNEECQRKEELQAKIDEFAAATTRLRRAAVDADEWFYELAPYDDATDALLAAATKEDDRG